jgi:hypothetical protein
MLRRMLKTEVLMKRCTITILSLLVLGGCAYGELKQVLRAQVAAETNCGDVTVESTPIYMPGYKPGQYRVKGCGVDRTYECPKEDGLVAYGDKLCKAVEAKAPAAAPAPVGDPALDEADPALDAPMDEPTTGGELPDAP